ncbi:hypothetical protein SAMN05421594_0566 [Chryseobacterium oleae]|uniref:TonB-linked outer membrane protein, SusC/RagA family n=1 Tax=Chryseobacterium oleae TaxID=491207 RepID=A0A1I4VSD2_CHROL|nr:hypothetical protein [Chryseobacterium oleae]SFN04007.1 hypothetical protein SAMN05421594_0566 [Chryseobacterium oleae]
MKKIYLVLLPFAANFLFSQNSQLYYSGIFLNKKDKPQNFLKVYNKNNGIYELTDGKGFAIIAAKENDTLIWNDGKSKLVARGLRELKSILESRTEKASVWTTRSRAYDSLVTKELKDEFSVEDSKEYVIGKSAYNFSAVRKIKKVTDNTYYLREQPNKFIDFSGSFTTSFDVKTRNSIPHTQNRYVQGRSQNGLLEWQGPETGEMFSFGPDISSLGFDHHPYEYDWNGRLIPVGTGISPAKAYNNDIFKTVFSHNNQLRLNTSLNKGYYSEQLRLSLDLGQQKDQMYFVDQYNIFNTFKTKLSSEILKFSVNLGFNYDENKAVNSNRTGLFNRVYQNALLTPVSFSNAQNALLTNGLQRSYGQSADNPYFLLEQENKYNYRDRRRQFSFGLERNFSDFKLMISQSYENDRFMNVDYRYPSASGFTNGLYSERSQQNKLYSSNVSGSYTFGESDRRSVVSLNFLLNDRKSEVYNSLTKTDYVYQRTSQDYILNYKYDYSSYRSDISAGFNAGNAFYISNTSAENTYWLPKVNAYLTFQNIFNWNSVDFKILGAYTEMSSEPEITKSYASYATTLLKAQNAHQYFPVLEAQTFRNLSNINSKEGKAGFRLKATYNMSLEAEYFNRKVINDIFPVFDNNQLQLKNLADHTYSGYEANFIYDNMYLGTDFKMSNKVSFFKYKDVVDRVNAGYNNLSVAGFSDVYKTLSGGQVFGAVMGSYFERNAAGELIIDEFGYPKKADGLKIIADPTPDFVVKFNHTINYKMFSLDINWEWKKGGQIWNGTKAVLDYYGRSQNSGDERNIKNYVFQGVDSNGSPNQIPVDFYNPAQNVSQNRWTRYGYLGVAEDYVQKADYVRINTISLTGKFDVGRFKRGLGITFYVNNILLWQANQGADPNQNFYDLDSGKGLDFFNLPSYKTFGCMVSFQF